MDKLYTYLTEKLVKNEPFAFTRWGDGEWSCMMGKMGQNCDGHSYSPSLAKALRSVLQKQQSYYYGLQPKAAHDMGEEIEGLLKVLGVDIPFVNADIFHDASAENLLVDFFKAIEKQRVVLVGSSQLVMMRMYFPSMTHIEVPATDAWLDYEHIRDKLETTLMARRNDVVLFSCGMMANVLIDDLWSGMFSDMTLINTGSVFDPYCGRCTRKYHPQIITKLGEGT